MSEVFNVQDTEVLDLFHHLKAVSHLLSYLIGEYRKDGKLSQARMRLLIRLVIDNKLGIDAGLQPSALSESLGVSRNTVSALLNGLQEQGLIERHLHPTDRRQFLIRITPAGCDLVYTRAPQFAAFIASLFEHLSPDERHTLFALLDKLYSRMLERAVEIGINVPGIDPETFNEST
jgi:DNA-binding MarR family transcriptional regulator